MKSTDLGKEKGQLINHLTQIAQLKYILATN